MPGIFSPVSPISLTWSTAKPSCSRRRTWWGTPPSAWRHKRRPIRNARRIAVRRRTVWVKRGALRWAELGHKPRRGFIGIHLPHQRLDLAYVFRPRIIGLQLFFHALSPIIAPQRELPRQEANPLRHRLELGSSRIPSPAIVPALVPSAGALGNRDRGQQPVIERIRIRGLDILVDVKRLRTSIRLEKRIQFFHPNVWTCAGTSGRIDVNVT